jgi:CRP-like cAMP-binding protein
MDQLLQQKTAAFIQQFPRRAIEKGSILIHPEENITDVYYIVSGQVVQYDISPAGKEITVAKFRPPAFLPMSQAVNDTPNHFFFEAASNVTAYQVPVKKAALFVRRNPDIMYSLLQRAYRGTDNMLQRMVQLAIFQPK